MKVLLLGEYSNVHWTLSEGLRQLGHEVTVVSNGDGWKGYKRDVDLRRRSLGFVDTVSYLRDLWRTMPTLRGFDVVQLINPVFLDLKAERILPYYKRLRKQNGKLFLGAFGIDKPWVEEGLKADTFRYSDFYVDGRLRDTPEVEEMKSTWLLGAKGRLNDYIVDDCDGIIAGLYEYNVCYRRKYADKLTFIPFPINHDNITLKQPHPEYDGIRFFIGIQRHRSSYKGTDIMLSALQTLQNRYPDRMETVVAENVPYERYEQMLSSSDVLLDQLYSYTPAMNALLAMAKGLVVVGGGEEEQYELLGERELRPIVNVRPTMNVRSGNDDLTKRETLEGSGEQNDVVEQIERRLLTEAGSVQRLSQESMAYTRRWHDHIRVAQQYVDTWQSR